MKVDVRIFKDGEQLSLAAAAFFVAAAEQALSARGRFLVALSGGSTPKKLYQLLTQQPYRDRIDWAKTFVFWGDERSVPPDDEGSNYRQAREILLEHVPIPAGQILRIEGEPTPVEAARDYTQTLKRFAAPRLDWPRFDLALLGMGADGHTASLFPGSPVEATSPVLPVTADYKGRPAQRITLTPMVFNSARSILFLVTGSDKADMLKHVLHGEYMPEQYPAQRIRPMDGTVTWLVDEAAGKKLYPVLPIFRDEGSEN